MTQCIVCNNFNMSIFIPSSNVKEGVFCILQMLRIHTGLRKWNKNDQFHIIISDMNPLGIKQPCLMVAKNEVLFEQNRISLKREKMQLILKGRMKSSVTIFFHFVLRMFDNLNQLYEMKKSLLIDAILKYHLRNDSDEENLSEPSLSRKDSAKENTSKPSTSRKDSVEENSSKPSPSRK